jgi:citrate lyase subunit beta/citryl-CoA lyase
MGFNGKSLINPRQIELLHNAYAPTQEEVDYAERVLLPPKKVNVAGWVSFL